MGASQNRRSGTSSGTTLVPYPRSIPLFHTSLKDPFHTSVPYLWSIRYDIYIYYIYIYLFNYIYIWRICAVWFYICTRVLERTYIDMQEYVYYAQALWLCWQVCACSVCCVMVGMCLAVVGWQSKNGLLVTGPPSQPVADLRLHHLQLLPAVAQLWCLMVEMRLAVASWQSKNCLLRYSRSKLPILIKMCCVVAELCWSAVSFQTPFHTVPYLFHARSRPGPPMYHPWPTSGWTNRRFSHRLLLSHPLRVGFGSLESCYAGTQSTP